MSRVITCNKRHIIKYNYFSSYHLSLVDTGKARGGSINAVITYLFGDLSNHFLKTAAEPKGFELGQNDIKHTMSHLIRTSPIQKDFKTA